MRGEDTARIPANTPANGSPPHARGRQACVCREGVCRRITPACAGKTFYYRIRQGPYQDHPRMRGEDSLHLSAARCRDGSPPHARGRRPTRLGWDPIEGITPACAGKTNLTNTSKRAIPDHPRMRGEDGSLLAARPVELGSPPHARGRRSRRPILEMSIQDHPRMRGEDNTIRRIIAVAVGSPPHARGRRRIPTIQIKGSRDHPRMRGEDAKLHLNSLYGKGSPPHARGRPSPNGEC